MLSDRSWPIQAIQPGAGPPDIQAHSCQSAQQWRAVMQPPGNEVAHFLLAVPHAVDRQQPRVKQFSVPLLAQRPPNDHVHRADVAVLRQKADAFGEAGRAPAP